jgi:hypothetical protein
MAQERDEGHEALTRLAGSRGRMTLHCWRRLVLVGAVSCGVRWFASGLDRRGVSRRSMKQPGSFQHTKIVLECSLGVRAVVAVYYTPRGNELPQCQARGTRTAPTYVPRRHWWKNATPSSAAILCHYARQPTLPQVQLYPIRQPPILVTQREKGDTMSRISRCRAPNSPDGPQPCIQPPSLALVVGVLGESKMRI